MARMLVSEMDILVGGQPQRFSVSVDYNANNGRVNGLFVSNGTSRIVHAEARFDQPVAGQTTWGQNFTPGDTLMNLPANVLTVMDYIDDDDVPGKRLEPPCAISLSTT